MMNEHLLWVSLTSVTGEQEDHQIMLDDQKSVCLSCTADMEANQVLESKHSEKIHLILCPGCWRTMFLLFSSLVFITGIVGGASASCTEDQYQVASKCCTKCPPGSKVDRHCSAGEERVCKPCEEGTFQEDYNGRRECFTCSKCDAGLGLKVKESCTLTSDALCEPLDGYFCSDSNRGGCTAAQRHKVCLPGESINQTGTAHEDTECRQCPDGTFSNGTSTSCQEHRICSSEGGLVLKQLGTNSTDSECVESAMRVSLRIAIILAVVALVVIPVLAGVYQTHCKKKKSTSEDEAEAVPLQTGDSNGKQGPTSTYHNDQCDDEGSRCRPESGSSSTHNGHSTNSG